MKGLSMQILLNIVYRNTLPKIHRVDIIAMMSTLILCNRNDFGKFYNSL